VPGCDSMSCKLQALRGSAPKKPLTSVPELERLLGKELSGGSCQGYFCSDCLATCSQDQRAWQCPESQFPDSGACSFPDPGIPDGSLPTLPRLLV